MKKICTTMLALLILVIVGKAQEKITKSFDGIKELSVNLGSGDCTFKKGSTNTIQVELQYTYDNDEFTPTFEQQGSKLTLKEKFERGSHSGWSKWTVTVPNGLETTVNSGSGDLVASNLQMDITSNLGSGDIEFSETSGKISINTGSGNVEMDEQQGNVSVNTGSGDIQLKSGDGSIKINAGSGDITLSDSQGSFKVNTGSGDIVAKNVSITDKSGFNTGSGDAEVVLESALEHDISINSGSGSSILDFNNNAISGAITMKANKRNGRIEAPFDFDKVEEEQHGDQTVVIKTAKIGNKDIKINVATGSGKAAIVK